MTSYSFEDLDLWIEVARKYVNVTGEVPAFVMVAFDNMTAGDQRLALYAMNRILRFPKLRKVLAAREIEDAADPDSGIQHTPLVVKPSFQMPQQDQMFL